MRTITLLLSLPCAVTSFAQSYRPFPEGGAQWSEYNTVINCCGPGSNTMDCQRIYYFDTDTIIDGMSYHKILFNESCLINYIWDPWPSWTTGQTAALGTYLRQDSIARRVYQWTPLLGDTLLYDLNMGLGPYPATSIQGVPLQVIAIDSVLLGDGWHKRWMLDASDFAMNPYAVIEGIGSTFGLLGPMYPPFEASQDLICFKQDSALIYKNAMLFDGVGCDLSVGTRPSPSSFDATDVRPNPFDQFISLDPSIQGPVRYRFVHASGSVALVGTTTGTIDTSSLKSGHYILVLSGTEGAALLQRSMIKL